MNITEQMQQFSIAYVHAISSVAGYACERPSVDDNSVDVSFKCSESPFPQVDVQLKSTANASYLRNGHFHFPLSIKNYNDLRSRTLVPRILILVVMPEADPTTWISHSVEQLSLMKCAYWFSLSDLPEKKNESSVTIEIPESNLFTSTALVQLMETVKATIS